jgi:transposase
MVLAHRITLDPKNKQRTNLTKAAETARFAYNWTVTEWQKQYVTWKTNGSPKWPSQMSFRRRLKLHIRDDETHKLLTARTTPLQTIEMEGLNVKGVLKNGKLARPISDIDIFGTRPQMIEKTGIRGKVADTSGQWLSSPIPYHGCSWKHKRLPVKDRGWTCETGHNRGVNAAINLENSTISHVTVSPTETAQEGKSSGNCRKMAVKPSPAKQEINRNSERVTTSRIAAV